jgi:putative transposase
MDAVDVKRLKQPGQENARLKKMLAERDVELDEMKETNAKMYGPPRLCKASVVDPTHVNLGRLQKTEFKAR